MGAPNRAINPHNGSFTRALAAAAPSIRDPARCTQQRGPNSSSIPGPVRPCRSTDVPDDVPEGCNEVCWYFCWYLFSGDPRKPVSKRALSLIAIPVEAPASRYSSTALRRSTTARATPSVHEQMRGSGSSCHPVRHRGQLHHATTGRDPSGLTPISPHSRVRIRRQGTLPPFPSSRRQRKLDRDNRPGTGVQIHDRADR